MFSFFRSKPQKEREELTRESKEIVSSNNRSLNFPNVSDLTQESAYNPYTLHDTDLRLKRMFVDPRFQVHMSKPQMYGDASYDYNFSPYHILINDIIVSLEKHKTIQNDVKEFVSRKKVPELRNNNYILTAKNPFFLESVRNLIKNIILVHGPVYACIPIYESYIPYRGKEYPEKQTNGVFLEDYPYVGRNDPLRFISLHKVLVRGWTAENEWIIEDFLARKDDPRVFKLPFVRSKKLAYGDSLTSLMMIEDSTKRRVSCELYTLHSVPRGQFAYSETNEIGIERDRPASGFFIIPYNIKS